MPNRLLIRPLTLAAALPAPACARPTHTPDAPRSRRTCGLHPAALRAALKDDGAAVRLTAGCLLTE